MPDGPDLLRRLLDDPPAIHTMGRPDALGVWATDAACYELLLRSVRPGDRTLETGAGLSTLVFAQAGAHHTVITPVGAEEGRVRAAAADLGVDLANTTFVIASSADALPALEPHPLDLVLVDGNHGFPSPVVDWFYAGRRLRDGGMLVVDDVQLPAVGTLLAYLEGDPAWPVHERSEKWVAFRRLGSSDLLLEHNRQPWYVSGRAKDLGSRQLASLLASAAVRSVRRRTGRTRRP